MDTEDLPPKQEEMTQGGEPVLEKENGEGPEATQAKEEGNEQVKEGKEEADDDEQLDEGNIEEKVEEEESNEQVKEENTEVKEEEEVEVESNEQVKEEENTEVKEEEELEVESNEQVKEEENTEVKQEEKVEEEESNEQVKEGHVEEQVEEEEKQQGEDEHQDKKTPGEVHKEAEGGLPIEQGAGEEHQNKDTEEKMEQESERDEQEQEQEADGEGGVNNEAKEQVLTDATESQESVINPQEKQTEEANESKESEEDFKELRVHAEMDKGKVSDEIAIVAETIVDPSSGDVKRLRKEYEESKTALSNQLKSTKETKRAAFEQRLEKKRNRKSAIELEREHMRQLFEIYHNGLLLVFKRYCISQVGSTSGGTFQEMSQRGERLDFIKFYRLCQDFGIAHKKGLSQGQLKILFIEIAKRGGNYQTIGFEQFRDVLVNCANVLLSQDPWKERYQDLPERARALFHRMDLAEERRAQLTKRMLAFGGFRSGDGKLGGHMDVGLSPAQEFSTFDFSSQTVPMSENGERVQLVDTFKRPGEPQTPPANCTRGPKKSVPQPAENSARVPHSRKPKNTRVKGERETRRKPAELDSKPLHVQNRFQLDQSAENQLIATLGLHFKHDEDIPTAPVSPQLPVPDLEPWENLEDLDIYGANGEAFHTFQFQHHPLQPPKLSSPLDADFTAIPSADYGGLRPVMSLQDRYSASNSGNPMGVSPKVNGILHHVQHTSPVRSLHRVPQARSRSKSPSPESPPSQASVGRGSAKRNGHRPAEEVQRVVRVDRRGRRLPQNSQHRKSPSPQRAPTKNRNAVQPAVPRGTQRAQVSPPRGRNAHGLPGRPKETSVPNSKQRSSPRALRHVQQPDMYAQPHRGYHEHHVPHYVGHSAEPAPQPQRSYMYGFYD